MKLKCPLLTDPAGPTKDRPEFDAIIVTEETIDGAKYVNDVLNLFKIKLRTKNQVSLLKPFVIDIISSKSEKAGDFSKKFGSSYIRSYISSKLSSETY